MQFEGFTVDDFDAYLPEKWSSNMFTLPRRKVRDRLDLLGRKLGELFQSVDLELTPHLSDDHPSLWNNKKVDTQWLFFSRNEAARKEITEIIDTERTLAATLADPTPLYRHVFVGVALNQHHIEVGIRLHFDAWVDRKNLLALVNDSAKGAALADLIRTDLTSEYLIGTSDESGTPASDITQECIARTAADFERKPGWFFIERRYDRAAATAAGPELLNYICADVLKLLSVYRFIAWAPNNDAISIDRIVARIHEDREAHMRELTEEQHRRELKKAGEEAETKKHREEIEERVREDDVWRQRERSIRRAQAMARAEEESRRPTSRVSAHPASPGAPAPQAVEPDGNAFPARLQTEEVSKPVLQPKPQSEPPHNSRAVRKERPSKPAEEHRRHPARSDSADFSRKSHHSDKPAMPVAAKPHIVSDKRREDIQVSDKVEILSGFLKGRIGIVQSIDEKGDLKVNFGALSSRVPRKDVRGLGPL